MCKSTASHECYLIKVEKNIAEIAVSTSFVNMIENQKIILNIIIDIQK